MPLQDITLDDLSIDDKDKLDAFRVRYTDLQDCLGAKIFRGILVLEQEKTGSQLDVLNKTAKRHIITSFDAWKSLCDIRNIFSHEYPESDDERREALYEAYQSSPELLSVVDKVRTYAADILGIEMSAFEWVSSS